jgi:hypothetical protein
MTWQMYSSQQSPTVRGFPRDRPNPPTGIVRRTRGLAGCRKGNKLPSTRCTWRPKPRRGSRSTVSVDPDLAVRREVLDERPLLHRLVGDRVLLVGPRDGLEDVVDPVIGRVDLGQERRPRRPRVGRHRRAQVPFCPRSIRACRFGRAPRSSRGSRIQSAPSHPMSSTARH